VSYLSSQSRGRTEIAIIAIINVVDFYIDKPDIVKQLQAADPKSPALEGYIYEAMREATPTQVWRYAKILVAQVSTLRSGVSIVSPSVPHVERLLLSYRSISRKPDCW
jgi:hypothetical protein